MAFKRRSRKSFKGKARKRSFKRRVTRGKVVKRRRMGTRKRSFKRKSSYKRVVTARVPQNIFPKAADRVYHRIRSDLQMAVTWGSGAPSFVGMKLSNLLRIAQTTLALSTFGNIWTAGGTNLQSVNTISPQVGTESLGNRYKSYYVTGVSFRVLVKNQSLLGTEPATLAMGMGPLSGFENSELVSAADANWNPPTLASTPAPQPYFQTMLQQPYQVRGSLGPPVSGHQVYTMKQSYKLDKFTPIAYYANANYAGTPPSTAAPAGVPPVVSNTSTTCPIQYFWMFNDDGGASPTGNVNLDIRIQMIQHVTFFNPGFALVDAPS